MPSVSHYYFHVTDGRTRYDDAEGSVHPSFTVAYREAERIVRELASDDRAHPGFVVCVVDEGGNELARVPVDRRH
jgi:hypothetical protein